MILAQPTPDPSARPDSLTLARLDSCETTFCCSTCTYAPPVSAVPLVALVARLATILLGTSFNLVSVHGFVLFIECYVRSPNATSLLACRTRRWDRTVRRTDLC